MRGIPTTLDHDEIDDTLPATAKAVAQMKYW